MEKPTIKNNQYIFCEYVCGGYLQRGNYAHYDIKTTWTKELKLISFIIDNDDMMPLFRNDKVIKKIDIEKLEKKFKKWDLKFHYHRAIRAKNRHLKWLKISLGLEKEPEPDKPEKYICDPWNAYFEMRIYDIGKTKKGELKVSDLPYRHSSHVKATKEKIKLMEEYNKTLKIMKEIREKIFSEEK